MKISTSIKMFFCIIILIEGLREDRCVVRENSSFEMHCNHKLENVTRIRWEYISATDNKSESIYDSQYKEILKIGFEISCEPQQTLIRTCILKLIKARKEDSGKYICYVGMEGEANIDSNLVERIIEITELVVKGPIQKTIVVNVGDPIILQCEHNVKNLTRARWSHVSTKGVMTYQLYYMDWNKAYHNNYEGLCKSYEPSCNLKILETNKESAGKYICMVGESQEFEEKYGLFQMTYFIEIQLVVGELLCNDGLTEDQILIGENDCYGIEADVLNLKCSFNYFGNINYNLLHLRWIEKYKFNSLEKKLNSSLINHEVKDETKQISIQTNLPVSYEMQNSIFQCILDDTLVKPCQLQEFRIQYIKNTTVRSPPIYLNDLHNIKCSANKSENVHCSYYWVHEIGGAMVQNPYAILPVEHMNSPGKYICIAKCHLGKHECNIRAMQFEVITKSGDKRTMDHEPISGFSSGLIVGIVISFVGAISIIAMIFIYKNNFCLKMKRYFKVKMDNVEDNNEVDSLNTGYADGDKEAFLNIQFDKQSMNVRRRKSHKKKVARDRQTSQEVTKFFLKDSLTCDVNCEYPDHKQLIDIVRLEIMILLPIWDHPNPKNVLVVGKNEGRLAKILMSYPKVESTTVFEMDERNVILYCEYFPDLPISMEDPKVKVYTGDESKFLENNRNTFDVIINYSSNDPKISKACLTRKYYEDVKSALKKGGITTVIFSQDTMDCNIAEKRAQDFCKKIFTAVDFLKIPAFTRSIGPTSCLICSLNQETNSTMKRFMDNIIKSTTSLIGKTSKGIHKSSSDIIVHSQKKDD